jgi:hypothetical protein
MAVGLCTIGWIAKNCPPDPVGASHPLAEKNIILGNAVFYLDKSPANSSFQARPVSSETLTKLDLSQATLISTDAAPKGLSEYLTRTTKTITPAQQAEQLAFTKTYSDQLYAQASICAILGLGLFFTTRRR